MQIRREVDRARAAGLHASIDRQRVYREKIPRGGGVSERIKGVPGEHYASYYEIVEINGAPRAHFVRHAHV